MVKLTVREEIKAIGWRDFLSWYCIWSISKACDFLISVLHVICEVFVWIDDRLPNETLIGIPLALYFRVEPKIIAAHERKEQAMQSEGENDG